MNWMGAMMWMDDMNRKGAVELMNFMNWMGSMDWCYVLDGL